MALFEISDKGGMVVAFAKPELAGKSLGENIDVMDVVVDEMKEVADLLIGRRLHRRPAAADGIVDAGQLLAVAAIGLVTTDQRMR
ncbi:hypothetical protein D3C87_1894560 [compost metagenome]